VRACKAAAQDVTPGRLRAIAAAMTADFLASALVTLLVTLDPPGLAPIFLSLTQGMSRVERRQVAIRACIIAFGILAFFGVAGDVVLKALGVSLPAFRIAGGLLLFWIAFEMVFERRTERKQQTAQTAITLDHIRNVAAFPLAIPLMAGPGALTAIILLAGRAEGDPLLLVSLAVICGLVILACLVVFLLATPLARLLGVTGNVVLTRLLGVILAALAVQFVIDGVTAAIRAA
jgi:multiple antibiotic resistance protein